MRICIFDGADTVGGNKIYVQIDDKTGFFFDFGINFSEANRYFHDFLMERSVRGINPYIELDLLPKLDIYRSDLIPADVDASSFQKLPVAAVLLSHAHADHSGMLGTLREDVGVVASPITLALLKALKDSGQTGVGVDYLYFRPREPDESGHILNTPRNADVRWRPIYTSECPDSLTHFMSLSPFSKGSFPPPKVGSLDDLPVEVSMYPVDHSVPGAVGFIVRADVTVAYTGDLRMHGIRAGETKAFIRAAREASILIIEGTRVSREDDRYVCEEDVREALDGAISEQEGPVFVNFNGSDIDRLSSVAEIAKKNGRELLIPEKLFYRLIAVRSCGYPVDLGNVGILLPLSGEKPRQWQKFLRDEYSDHYHGTPEVRGSFHEFVIYMNYHMLKDLTDLRPPGGVYIHSASEAFEEEQEFDFVRLSNWLEHYNIEVVGFEMRYDRVLGRERPFFVGNYHASGHLTPEEILRVIDEMDPDYVVPVHTNDPAWFLENVENARRLKEGEWWAVG